MLKEKTFKGELHDWGIVGWSSPDPERFDLFVEVKISGTVYGMERNDKQIITSRIVRVDGDFVETQNSIYLLVGDCMNKNNIDKRAKERWVELCLDS